MKFLAILRRRGWWQARRDDSRANHARWWRVHGPTPDFREHEKEIWGGQVPERYRRIAAFVNGSEVLDIGCGEGLLPIALADRQSVVGLDVSPKRIRLALSLQRRAFPQSAASVQFLCGDAVQYLRGAALPSTIIFNRSLYHFHADIPEILSIISKDEGVRELVLVGNESKAKLSVEDHDLGSWIRFSQEVGMLEALEKAGFKKYQVSGSEGDPIVVGKRP